MGLTAHNAIVVVGTDVVAIYGARRKAVEIFGGTEDGGPVSEIVGPTANNTCSFFVAPDGSKEGWASSDEGDINRHLFIDYLRAVADYSRSGRGDGPCPLDWVEVRFGEVPAHICRSHRATEEI